MIKKDELSLIRFYFLYNILYMNGVSYIPFPHVKAYRCSMYAAICMDNIQTVAEFIIRSTPDQLSHLRRQWTLKTKSPVFNGLT